MRHGCFYVFVLLFAISGLAARAGAPYPVDDPASAEKQHWNLIMAYTSSQVKGSETQSLPNANLAYGLTSNIELNLNVGIVSTRTSDTPRSWNFGDTSVGVRWRFQDETRRRPQLLLGVYQSLPTGNSARGAGLSATSSTIYVAAGRTLKRWYLFANAGVNITTASDSTPNTFYGIAAAYQLNERTQLGGFINGTSSPAPGSRDELAVGICLTHNLRADRQILLMCGHSLRGNADLNTFAGYSWTFK